MSLDYIRKRYSVPAYFRQRIRYTGGRKPRIGRIWRGSNGHLLVMFGGDSRVKRLHPTWEVKYLPPFPKHFKGNAQ